MSSFQEKESLRGEEGRGADIEEGVVVARFGFTEAVVIADSISCEGETGVGEGEASL